jgi:carboxylate-amine ligase
MAMGLPEFTVGIEEEYQIIDPETRELTSYVQKFLEQGTSADRQLDVYDRTQSLEAVVDHLIEETRADCV